MTDLVLAPMAFFLGRNQIDFEQNRLGIESQQFQKQKSRFLALLQTSKDEKSFSSLFKPSL
jgi:hypothetical protein